MASLHIGVVGCGSFARGAYMETMQGFSNSRITAVCDIVPERAEFFRRHFDIPHAFHHIDELLEKGDVDVIVDLASIHAHEEINRKALQAGKHLYSQKPFATTVEVADQLIRLAQEENVKFAASPIHMLRPDIQRAKQWIDDGVIGKVTFIRCRSSHGGPEYFQYRDIDPSWFYHPGAGPVYDMGVHGLHQVTGLLGPASHVQCVSGLAENPRTVRSGAFDGHSIEPQVDDNTHFLLEFDGAVFAFVDSSYCVKAARGPYMEVYGTHGTLSFVREGRRLDVYVDCTEKNMRGWIEPMERWPNFEQAYGVKDLLAAVEADRPPVLSAQHARHVIEIMEKAPQASAERRAFALDTTF